MKLNTVCTPIFFVFRYFHGFITNFVSRLVVLAVPMTLSDLPPYAKGTLSIESYPKLLNLHEITQFFPDLMLTFLHF